VKKEGKSCIMKSSHEGNVPRWELNRDRVQMDPFTPNSKQLNDVLSPGWSLGPLDVDFNWDLLDYDRSCRLADVART
jgi:hypothetical protein